MPPFPAACDGSELLVDYWTDQIQGVCLERAGGLLGPCARQIGWSGRRFQIPRSAKWRAK